jgi:hypothetical protein
VKIRYRTRSMAWARSSVGLGVKVMRMGYV